MKPLVCIVAPGSMGAAIGARLVTRGLTVLTHLVGRSQHSRQRAAAAGLTVVAESELVEADILLSIVPPGVAWSFADRTAQLLRTRERRLLFAECNAVSPAVVTGIGERMSAAGAVFADAGIIGQPPGLDGSSPRIYASGPAAEQLAVLREYGLDVRVLAKPLGAASALKMCYAGITKGVSAVGSAMLMASEHAGVADALARELADSQAGLRAHLGRTLPSIFGRAYRWVAEMQYIAEFAGEHDPAAAEIFRGAAALYERIARTGAAASDDAALIARFLRRGG